MGSKVFDVLQILRPSGADDAFLIGLLDQFCRLLQLSLLRINVRKVAR